MFYKTNEVRTKKKTKKRDNHATYVCLYAIHRNGKTNDVSETHEGYFRLSVKYISIHYINI